MNYPIPIKFGKHIKISIWHKTEILQIQDGGRTPYWKSFLAISRRHIDRWTRNLERRWRITCGRHIMTKTAIFQNSRWWTAAILKIALSQLSQLWVIWFRSNLVRTCTFYLPGWTFNKNIEILQIQDGGRTPYWKSFLAISRRHIGRIKRNLEWRWRITCRYRSGDACLGGSVGWDTVRTDRDGLSEESGFNPRVGR